MAVPSPTIGDIAVQSIPARVPKLGQQLRDISRPGKDGHAYVKAGARAEPVEFVTVLDVTSAANAEAYITACTALKGTLVTVKYDDDVEEANVAVLDVMPVRVRRVESPVGGINGGDWLVTMRWVLQKAVS